LDLTECRLFDPNLAVKDLADEVAFTVAGDPRLWVLVGEQIYVWGGAHFVFVAVLGAQAFKALLRIIHLGVLAVVPELPGADVAAVSTVENNAHALERSKERCSTKHPSDRTDGPPRPHAVPAHQSDDQRSQESAQDAEHAQAHRKDDAGLVAVADRPADEIRVRLEPEEALDVVSHVLHGRGVGRVRQGKEDHGPVAGRQVEFAG